MYKKKQWQRYILEEKRAAQPSVIKHTRNTTDIVDSEFSNALPKNKDISEERLADLNPLEPSSRQRSEVSINEGNYEETSTYVDQVLSGSEIQTLPKDLRILTPPPESSFPYDAQRKICGEKLADSRRESHESSLSSLSQKSNETKSKKPGKDERLAREKGITSFISVFEIINIPMDEFNDRLAKHRTEGMTQEQHDVARDIRRRGKNKNAAQNCRKRAQQRIEQLRDDVSRETSKKRKLEDAERRLDEELRREEHMHSELAHMILVEEDLDPNHWMLENDLKSGSVKYKKVSPEQDRLSPSRSHARLQEQHILPLPQMPYSRSHVFQHQETTIVHRPIAQVVLEKVNPNHHVEHRPPYYYGLPYSNQPAVSLFPVVPRAPVSLYPVARFSAPEPRYNNHHERNSVYGDSPLFPHQVDIPRYPLDYTSRHRKRQETVIKEESPFDLSK